MVELDEADQKILRELQQDARASFKTIADKAGVSEATVFVRVKKLQEKGVIKGFKAIVDPRAVGKNLTAIVLVRANPKYSPECWMHCERSTIFTKYTMLRGSTIRFSRSEQAAPMS